MTHLRCDRTCTRTATLWMLDRTTMVEIPEDNWPPATHGDDAHAARQWSKLSGLTVTIRTETLTTLEAPREAID